MIQKCSIMHVLEVFFKEPTSVHFIREISKKINLAPTSVRNNLQLLLKEGFILTKESKPFNGFVANRNSDQFIFTKRCYNLYSLYTLRNELIEKIGPQAIILFGSYSRGEDIESSDIDLIVLSKTKREMNIVAFEKKLERKLHFLFTKDLETMDESLRKNVFDGVTIYGNAHG